MCGERMLCRCAFWCFQSGIFFPRFLGQIEHDAGGFADSLRDLKAQVHGDSGTEVGEFVYYLESVVGDFDFRGMADILGNHPLNSFHLRCLVWHFVRPKCHTRWRIC